MLLVELAASVEDPPTPHRVLPQPILNHRLDQTPLHPRSQLLIIDPPLSSRRAPHALGLEERARVPAPRLLHLSQAFTRIGEDVADLEDEGAVLVWDEPGGAGWGIGEAGREVGDGREVAEVSDDFVQGDGAWEKVRVSMGKQDERRENARESLSSIPWTSFSARSRMMPKTVAT